MTTPFSSLDDADFGVAAQNLLPRGRAWPRQGGTLLSAFMQAIGDGLSYFHGYAVNFLEVESNPATAVQLLPDYETDYGLPDPCSVSGGTTAQRQAAVLAKIASIGGQSAAYFIGIAAALGYSVTITTFTPSYCGTMECGDPITGPDWLFAWEVNAPSGTGADLACRLGQIGPAYGVMWVNIA